jgi:tetratricopeptide (TPR) repeat protein
VVRLSPIPGSLSIGDRPDLAWPAAEGVATYRVRMTIEGSGRELWTSETKSPSLVYPADRRPLPRTRNFSWTVADPDGKILVRGHFRTASSDVAEKAGEIVGLAEKDDPIDVLAAILAFESMGALAEATTAAERLTKLSPDDPTAHLGLADLYERGGRAEDARQAASRADELAKKPR